MKNKLFLTILVFCSSQFVFSQAHYFILQDWANSIGIQDSIYKVPSTYDAEGNFIMASFTIDEVSGADIIVASYDTLGNPLWSQTWTGAGHNRDQAIEITTDDSCNVYVAGFTYSDITNFDWIIIKYDSSGNQKWTFTHNGTANNYDIPTSLSVYNSKLYVTGTSFNLTSLLDFTTIQLDKVSGTENWIREYKSPYHLFDVPYKVNSNSSMVGVLGACQQNGGQWAYTIIVYDSTGAELDTISADGSSNLFDSPKAVKTDPFGNLYITGFIFDSLQNKNVRTGKIAEDGTVQWVVDWGIGSDAIGNDLIIDVYGNVYVCGKTNQPGHSSDLLLIKYNSTGSVVWDTAYYFSGESEVAIKLAFDHSGNVIVTGYSTKASTDFLTMAINPDSATILWHVYYSGDFGGEDKPVSLLIDESDNIFVSGQSQTSDTTYEQVTIMYRTEYFIFPPETIPPPPNMLFYPNHGQIVDVNDSVRNDITFYTINQYPKLYFQQDTVSFVYGKIDDDSTTVDSLERISMSLVGGAMTDPGSDVYHDTDQVLNYFLGHCPDGITDVAGCEMLGYFDVYDDIIALFQNDSAGMKFSFYVEPNGEPSQIVLHFEGHQQLSLISGADLRVDGILGSFIYKRPLAYLFDGGPRIPVGWLASYFILDSANVAITLGGSWDHDKYLVLECARQNFSNNILHIENPEWMTSFGDVDDEIATSCTNDLDGNFYVTGFTNGADFPTSVGQTPHHGNTDAFISRFGTADPPYPSLIADLKQWSTYFGGGNDDKAWSISTIGDGSGQVFVVGEAESGFPTFSNGITSSYNQTSNNGMKDAFLVELSSQNGAPIVSPSPWSTFIGGTDDDIANTVKCDPNGNIFIGGTTKSAACSSAFFCADPTDNNFPLCHTLSTGFFQSVNEGGGDAFLVMFDVAKDLQLSTLFGGDAEDIIKTISVDGNGNVIVGGSTASQNSFPLDPSSNYDQTTNGGGIDGFIAKFNSDLSQDWCTYYGGFGDDIINTIDIDSDNHIYFGGKTTSDQPAPTASLTIGCPTTLFNCSVPPTGKFPMCNPGGDTYFQFEPLCGNGNFGGGITDGFFSEFSTTGDLMWSTYYGGNGEDEINGISVNDEDYVFFTGKTSSPFSTFPWQFFQGWGAYQNAGNGPVNGGSSGFYGHFDKSTSLAANELLWSTYASDWHLFYQPVDEGMNAISTHNRFFYTAGYTSGPLHQIINSFDCCTHGYGQFWVANRDALLVRSSMDAMWMINVQEVNGPIGLIHLYPNPSNTDLTYTVDFNKSASYLLQIFTPLGSLVYDFKEDLKTERATRQIDLSNFNSGIYFIRVTTTDGTLTSKFIVEK